MFTQKLELKANLSQQDLQERLFEYNMSTLRRLVYEYILNNDLTQNFFNLEHFFSTYSKDQRYIDEIKSELNENGWHIKDIYGNTALIICKTPEDLENNLWNSTM